jgi:sarcosine oxidase subunit alpha
MTARRVRRGDRPDNRAVVAILVDGETVPARAGEPLAAALLCAGRRALRRSPRDGQPRGAFCFMGVCQECVVEVDGARAQACLTPARDGMVVRLPGFGP